MKLTTSITCECTVSARLTERGECSVKVFVSAPYHTEGKAVATASADVVPSAQACAAIKAALEAARTEVGPQLATAIQDAVFAARRVALQRGELAPKEPQATEGA